MNRETVNKEIQAITANHILLELPTGFGKSKQALDLMAKKRPKSILVVIHRLVQVPNWKDEFIKWGYESLIDKITFSTYVGLNKLAEQSFDYMIADECHHLSSRALRYISNIKIKSAVLLSATVGEDKKEELKGYFKDLFCYEVTMKDALGEVLPDPRVILVPLKLDNKHRSYEISLRRLKGTSLKEKSVICDYPERWKVLKAAKINITARCTQVEVIYELNQKIDFYKGKYMRTKNEFLKNKWLQLAGQRLKYLSEFKLDFSRLLLSYLKDHRSIIFCGSIEQTKVFGDNCVNSQNKLSMDVLEKFNKGRINCITSVNMLNEGMNLVDCQIGIFNVLNSSDIMIKQKTGRLLRHKDPILIIPYFEGTREKEIVEQMLDNYNPDLVEIIKDLKDLVI